MLNRTLRMAIFAALALVGGAMAHGTERNPPQQPNQTPRPAPSPNVPVGNTNQGGQQAQGQGQGQTTPQTPRRKPPGQLIGDVLEGTGI